jgi:fructose-1,6-bisphosphatase II
MRRLCMDLVRCTDGAAIAASEWIGTGEKELADKAATDAFRDRLNKMQFRGRVVIGEGEKDRSYGLFADERVGVLRDHRAPEEILKPYDIAIDPIEGTRPVVTSGPEALSVIGVAEAGAMLPIDSFYCLKIAYGRELAEANTMYPISVERPIEENVEIAANRLQKPMDRIVVCILDRPRHKGYIEALRKVGCRIKLIQDCDVSGALATCLPDSGVDLLYGIGGAPEAVITACAMKCLKGGIQVKLCSNGGEVNPDSAVFKTNDLVKGDCVFAATGITNGSLLEGVRFTPRGAVTSSVFMRSESGTIRWVKTEHGN